MSEGLAAMQHEHVAAPTDDDLINELETEVDKAAAEYETKKTENDAATAAKRAETAARLAELDAKPDVDVKGERAPGITESDVAGEKAGETAAADRTLLRDQLVDLVKEEAGPEPQASAASPELQELKAISQRMMELHEQQVTGKGPAERAAAANTPEAIARQAYEAAQQAQAEAQKYREELAEQQRERRIEALENGIVAYATAQGDKYPLVNNGNQKLVSAAMFQSIQDGDPMSEDQALAHVEGKLTEYVEESAARLGWTPPGEQSNAGASSKGTQVAETSLSKESTGAPAARGPKKAWDEMSDKERDDALVNLL